jgi:Helix-hairpin-helix motif
MAQNINQMNREQLASLQGLTAQIADEIIARRRSRDFTSLDELAEIPGIGIKRIEQLKQQGLVCLPSKSQDPSKSGAASSPQARTPEAYALVAPPAEPTPLAKVPAPIKPDKQPGEIFQCRSCGRTLPSTERETSQTWAQNICVACFLNIFNAHVILDGG